MGKGLYRKLAVTNLGKNRKYYFPYILSCTLMVMLHFLLCTLSMSSAWEVIPSNAVLYSILGLGTVVTSYSRISTFPGFIIFSNIDIVKPIFCLRPFLFGGIMIKHVFWEKEGMDPWRKTIRRC